MSFNQIPAGRDIPNDFNVIIEIPAHGEPVKYEVDKDSGALFVDRFMSTPMHYPTNYGYIPQTLADDGDPADVLVMTPVPINSGVVIRCRPIGLLQMTDESGDDAKILAVPVDKLCKVYRQVKSIDDVDPNLLAQIKHFFEHYKDLEEGKWVKVQQWEGVEAARQEILTGAEKYSTTKAAASA